MIYRLLHMIASLPATKQLPANDDVTMTLGNHYLYSSFLPIGTKIFSTDHGSAIHEKSVDTVSARGAPTLESFILVAVQAHERTVLWSIDTLNIARRMEVAHVFVGLANAVTFRA